MKVTRDRVIQTLHLALVRAAKMPEPTVENQKDWLETVIQPLDDLIFDHYVEFTPPEPPDEVLLREVTNNFQLKIGPWSELLIRLDGRVNRLCKLISMDSPTAITSGVLDSIERVLKTIRERVEIE